jgi:hypothetical protein
MREIFLPIDPSTPLKLHSEERGKKSRSGSTMSMPVRKHGVAEGLAEKKLVEAREGMTIMKAA